MDPAHGEVQVQGDPYHTSEKDPGLGNGTLCTESQKDRRIKDIPFCEEKGFRIKEKRYYK